MLLFLDYFIAVFHLSLTLFNVFGWAFPFTRKWHLISLGLTLGAWLILGIWYGVGYCPLTDWHWYIKRTLGEKGLPYSCIKYYADKVFEMNFDAIFINEMTATVMVLLVISTVAVNRRLFLSWLKNFKKRLF